MRHFSPIAFFTLFLSLLRLHIEPQRKPHRPACIRRPRRLGLGDVARIDRNNADALAVGGHHHPVGLILAEAEFAGQHFHDEFSRREIVVEQDDFVEFGLFNLELGL